MVRSGEGSRMRICLAGDRLECDAGSISMILRWAQLESYACSLRPTCEGDHTDHAGLKRAIATSCGCAPVGASRCRGLPQDGSVAQRPVQFPTGTRRICQLPDDPTAAART